MRLARRLAASPWWLVSASIAGLLLALLVVGVLGLTLNQNVDRVTTRALDYDIDLEDEGDDLRVAVLDLRHYHRNITFGDLSRTNLQRFEQAYADLHEEIDELEAIGVEDPLVRPRDLRRQAREYYEGFHAAIAIHPDRPGGDEARFTAASDLGLVRLGRLEEHAHAIDRLGERRAEAALTRIDDTIATSTLALLTLLGGLVLVGTALAYAAVRGLRDVRRAYAREQSAGEELARALKAKTDFIADASHELRTPLTVLRGNAEVGIALNADCEHAEILEEIVDEATRMTRLVEDLLFLARSDSESLPLRLRTAAVAELLPGIVRPARMLASRGGVRLRTDLRGDGFVHADATRIEQVVLILVDNAVKYSPAGESVLLRSHAEGGELLIEVADRGPGIPEEHLGMIFERFYRVDKARARKHGGAGLGLSIAMTIVEAHGGRIRAYSGPGEGARFVVRLPLVSAPPAREGTETTTATA